MIALCTDGLGEVEEESPAGQGRERVVGKSAWAAGVAKSSRHKLLRSASAIPLCLAPTTFWFDEPNTKPRQLLLSTRLPIAGRSDLRNVGYTRATASASASAASGLDRTQGALW